MICITEGIPVRDGQELLLADSPQAFADAVLRLLDDAQSGSPVLIRRQRVAKAGQHDEQHDRRATHPGTGRLGDGACTGDHEEGDLQAREQLIEQYMSLVRSLARRYSYRGEQLEDLVQIGAIGLIKAIDRFEMSREVALTSYATPNVVGEIKLKLRELAASLTLVADNGAKVRESLASRAASLRGPTTHSAPGPVAARRYTTTLCAPVRPAAGPSPHEAGRTSASSPPAGLNLPSPSCNGRNGGSWFAGCTRRACR